MLWVKEIDYKTAKAFIEEHHYSRGRSFPRSQPDTGRGFVPLDKSASTFVWANTESCRATRKNWEWLRPEATGRLPAVRSEQAPSKKEHGSTKKLSIYLVGEKEMDVCSWGLVVSITKC
jgi:hypothetical protein